MINVPDEHTFWLKGGKQIKNLSELVAHLQTMDDETFKHHVNTHKNDFANWIRHACKEERLAFRLESVQTKEGMAKHVTEHLLSGIERSNKNIKEERQAQAAKKNNPPVKKEERKTQQPIIIKTENYTPLTLTHKKEISTSPHVTRLHLGHKETEGTKHLSIVMTASYLAFGIVVGTALTILLLAL